MNNNDNMEKWLKNYKLAKNYYEFYGNLEIPISFKTKNGYEYEEEGVSLGRWLFIYRQAFKGMNAVKITEEQIQLLKKIGMRWKNINRNEEWLKRYELAKKYYEYHGNLEISVGFKTKNGYDEDENGFSLGRWVQTQRNARRGKIINKLTNDQIELLEKIGMRWNNLDRKEEWLKRYELAKKYYENYGNLEIPLKFKTKNGYVVDENGFSLGRWVQTQRNARRGKIINKLTNDQIELLEKIGIRWKNINQYEQWLKRYGLAKKYYEHYGNLEILQRFRTKNGYEYDENGFSLGRWIEIQRDARKGKRASKLSDDQIQLLEKIGMIWDVNKNFEEVSEICLQNTISIEANKKILKRITSSIFQAKISFLKDIGIPLVDGNGKLHEMFYLNNQSIQTEYGINMKKVLEIFSSSKTNQKTKQ